MKRKRSSIPDISVVLAQPRDEHDSAVARGIRLFPEDVTPLLLTAVEAATTCRTSVRTWRAWDAAGRVPRAVRIGRAKLWRPQELADWIAAGCPVRALWHWEPREVPAA